VLAVQRSDSVVAIIPASTVNDDKSGRPIRKAMQPILQAIANNISKSINGITVTIGVSIVVNDPADIGETYNQLRQMMRLARKINGAGQIVFWEDAQVYMMLGQLGETLERFYQSTLGEFDSPGLKNSEELLETLRVYLECQGNSVEAAAKLYIHRNTLRYRLERIEQILGRSLNSPEDRFSICLALKVRHLI
jgi:purine catabolism regulator